MLTVIPNHFARFLMWIAKIPVESKEFRLESFVLKLVAYVVVRIFLTCIDERINQIVLGFWVADSFHGP